MGLFVGNHLVSPVEIKEVEKSSRKYQLLDRVTDDSNNEIGTVGTFFIDANGVEYAVVVLDAKDRLNNANWTSISGGVTNLPLLNSAATVFMNKDTATFNTQKILDWCSVKNYTSESCSHCRSLSYIVDGTTYYGQLPNRHELYDLLTNYVAIDAADSSTGQTLATLLQSFIWSSSQCDNTYAWRVNLDSVVTNANKTSQVGVIPVLEIPNT